MIEICSRELLRAILFFATKNTVKKQTDFAWNFFSTPLQVCRGASFPYFNINAPFFCCPIFSEEYLQSQVGINKMINKLSITTLVFQD